ncbi:hypothetical protein [Alteribacillus sp. HJP-4]|uniref:hypothetical protein n=1 Tax=Alteribacillus sp. HJP-4 TaxID=2775394 RepID=UPI0035CD3BB4
MNRTVFLMRTAAIYALIGIFMGSHMAGAGSYALRPIHAHILVVGWLSLFAFAVFYRTVPIPAASKLAKVHVGSALIGSIGLTSGMWLYNGMPDSIFVLVFYIVGGSVLLLCFTAFTIMTFKYGHVMRDAGEK